VDCSTGRVGGFPDRVDQDGEMLESHAKGGRIGCEARHGTIEKVEDDSLQKRRSSVIRSRQRGNDLIVHPFHPDVVARTGAKQRGPAS
jgi:hypothetical protein